jgi:hypothetical protein
LIVSCRVGSGWSVGCHGPDWWSRRTDCYPIGDDHEFKEKEAMKKLFYGASGENSLFLNFSFNHEDGHRLSKVWLHLFPSKHPPNDE